ncbi:MAG: hypothetical protein DWQ02_02845 [Bacteroidetes bacterium]|nr:MAG: hypothetical protein DWQ02_02845 [Bacteroidota bacterium]
MKTKNIILLITTFLVFFIDLHSQTNDFDFPEEVIKTNGITKVTVEESHPNHTNINGDKIFHSAYEFYESGKIKSMLYLIPCPNEHRIFYCLERDSFDYEISEHIKMRIQFSPNKPIMFNANHNPYKTNRKLLKKMKKVRWKNSKTIELFKYDEKENELYRSVLYGEDQKEVKIFENKNEYQDDELVKRFIFDIDTGIPTLTDSIVIKGNIKECYYFFDDQIESKTIITKAPNSSSEKHLYSLEDNDFKLWRIYKYDKMNRIISETQGDYFTEYKYNEQGLIEEVVEKIGDHQIVIKQLSFRYE